MNNKYKKIIKPIFPTFKKLEIDDRAWMEEYIQKFPPYSDFNFVSLWNYNIQDKAEISLLNDNLVVKFFDYITGEPFYTFLGKNQVVETIQCLMDFALVNNMQPELKLIPEIIVNYVKKIDNFFIIHEDNDNHDYIFSVEQHTSLKGQKYKDKRNLVNRFKKENKYVVEELKISDKQVQKELIKIFLIWEKIQKKNSNETRHEYEALLRAFKAADKFNLFCLIVFVNKNPIAFAIGEIVHHNYAISHFEKTNNQFIGISSLLRVEVSKYLYKKGCEYFNYEQDLGIEGLRKAKKLWHPVHLLKKYKLALKH